MKNSQKVSADFIRNGSFVEIPFNQVRVGMSVAVLKYNIAFIANVLVEHEKYLEFTDGWKCDKHSGRFFIFHDCDLGI